MTAPDVEYEKRAAAEAAAALVEDGSAVGLGTGSTVAHLLSALARRRLRLRCVATSPHTEHAARSLGLAIEPIDPAGWLVKGAGGAHTRENVVASAAQRFIVIAASDKPVEVLRPPVPLELLAYGVAATLRRLERAALRDAPPSPDGGLIADYHGGITDPVALVRAVTAPIGA